MDRISAYFLPVVLLLGAILAPYTWMAALAGLMAGTLLTGAMIERGGTIWQRKPEYDADGNRITCEDRDW